MPALGASCTHTCNARLLEAHVSLKAMKMGDPSAALALERDLACLDEYDYFFRPDLLAGKVAFITGGGSGIGFTIAEVFMR